MSEQTFCAAHEEAQAAAREFVRQFGPELWEMFLQASRDGGGPVKVNAKTTFMAGVMLGFWSAKYGSDLVRMLREGFTP